MSDQAFLLLVVFGTKRYTYLTDAEDISAIQLLNLSGALKHAEIYETCIL